MKHLIKKISAARSNVLTHIKMGEDTLNVVCRDDALRGFYNGYEILCAPRTKEASMTMGYVLGDVLTASLAKSDKKAAVLVLENPRETDISQGYMSKILPDLKHAAGSRNVAVKRFPQDITVIQASMNPQSHTEKTADYETLQHNLRIFGNKVTHVAQTLSNAKDDAYMLTRKKIDPNMWGSAPVQQTLDTVHGDIIKEQDNWDKTDLCNELITKALSRLCTKIQGGVNQVSPADRQMIGMILIPTILSNYESLKALVMHALMCLAPLVYVDEAFKQHTSYPAKWFMSEDVMDGLQQNYDTLVKFATQVPGIESKIIDPISLMRFTFTSK